MLTWPPLALWPQRGQRRAREQTEPRCAGCTAFEAEPANLESELPGLLPMGSAYAAVRSSDGLCTTRARWVGAADTCTLFRARRAVA